MAWRLARSQCSYAQADELLRELSGLNFGVKRIQRVFDDWFPDAELSWP